MGKFDAVISEYEVRAARGTDLFRDLGQNGNATHFITYSGTDREERRSGPPDAGMKGPSESTRGASPHGGPEGQGPFGSPAPGPASFFFRANILVSTIRFHARDALDFLSTEGRSAEAWE